MATPRNYIAKALWTSKFRKQVVRNRKAYTRKQKHKESNNG